ncbi:SDR family oxidoreductase [Rhizobium cauense]|uniref:UDP-glucuronic acid decarboxylase family protein n=1 Tax=Rhizobium cauense TaxID=1166683 RepID=UPI001C6F2800|nr:UDP-glucuronic acid decarboxylase family protein [Rhizobium cauense]MBW9114989.1 SDR family oxidoreductase [Rhizobium cauense]
MNKRILVTGGAGFVGSNICARLLEQGHHVVCMDNFSTGAEQNVAALLDNARFSLLRQDITQAIAVDVDQIYNLACPASPIHYQADPIGTLKTNVVGALNILELSRQRNIPVLQASTSEVYGDPHVHPQSESYWGNVNPIGPRACYDEGKRSAETLFFDYRRQFGLPVKVARIFNTYGPRMHPSDGRVVANFVVQALSGRDLTIYGDGTQTRSFCYVDDLVAGLIAMMNSGPEVTGPLNLGNPEEFTIRELADIVLELTNSSSRIVHQPLPTDDPRQRLPDIAKARRLLGWAPTIRLREGLVRTIAYFETVVAKQSLVTAYVSDPSVPR